MTWAIAQKAGGPSAKAVLLSLANYASDSGCAWPGQQLLADESEQSIDSVQKRLADLAAAGLIRRIPLRHQGRRTIAFVVLAISPYWQAPAAELEPLLPRGHVVDADYEDQIPVPGAGDEIAPEGAGVANPSLPQSAAPSVPQTVPQPAADGTALVRYHEPAMNQGTLREARAREGSAEAEAERQSPDAELLKAAIRLHPTSAFEDRLAIEKAWRALSAAERKRASEMLGEWLEAGRKLGRTKPLGLASYFAQKAWENLATAPVAKGATLASGKRALGLFTRAWWCLVWQRVAANNGESFRRLRFQIELANGGNGCPSADDGGPSEAEELAQAQIAVETPEAEAWLKMLRDLAVPIRRKIGVPYLWAPSHWPPGVGAATKPAAETAVEAATSEAAE